MLRFFQKYLLPGFIFQSITIGGGYGTGRELVEFFLSKGPATGYLGMGVATLIWGVVLSLTFELARRSKAYDYRHLLQQLLGKGWWTYEIVYLAGLILVVSVVGSAAGELLTQITGWPSLVGTLLLMLLIGLLAFFGNRLIEQSLSAWSFLLYGVYIVLIIWVWQEEGEQIVQGWGMGTWNPVEGIQAGMEYAAYNVGILPAILFSARYIQTPKEAVTAGILGGLIAMFPGLCIYTAMVGAYPSITGEPIPANFLLSRLGSLPFQRIFQVVLFGTFVETGIGLIHGFNERLEGYFRERGRVLSHLSRVLIALVILVMGIFLADGVGLVQLIAQGYVVLNIGYWLVFLLPLLTVGIWRLWQQARLENK